MISIYKTFIRFHFPVLPVLLLLLLAAKANAQQPAIAHRIIFIGDAGKLVNGKNKVAEAAAGLLSGNDAPSTVVFLGNNIYPNGLPDKEDHDYESAAKILQQLTGAFKDTRAKIYVLPGERDWQNGTKNGWDAVRREGHYTDSLLKQKNVAFLPANGCPGPVEIDLGNNLILVLMDSQWWLHNFEKSGTANDCPCKTEDQISAKLKDIAYRNRSKRIIVAMHHPLESHGVHGGYFTLKQHIFPLTDAANGAYIPLPVLGSLYPFIRGTYGSQQDIKHPDYQNLITQVRDAMVMAPDVTFVGAHDHNLQLLRDGGRDYIVSGAGALTDRVKKGRHSLYAGDQPGFAVVDFRTDGDKKITFYTLDKNGKAQESFTNTPPEIPLPPDFKPDPATSKDFGRTVTAAIAQGYDSVSKRHRLFFGDNYRDIWAMPVPMRVFYLNEEKGGMTILQKGGGMQTKSLRLKDASGKEWVVRSMQKDPARALPLNLRKTLAKTIVQDQISAAHPYAPLSLPPMEEAIGLPHANPEIVYMPDDPALGVYRQDFANTACIFEEREPGGDAKEGKTYSTDKVLEKLEEDQDNVVDQQAVVKARLFDVLISDWDRHEDQWRWGKHETKGGPDIFYPVPRDRDQAYFNTGGVFPAIASRKWLLPKFQGFRKKIRDVDGMVFNARYFDRYFMNGLQEQDFTNAAVYIQQQLTDSLLDLSLRKMPTAVYAASGEEILTKLRMRRNNLPEYARTLYRFLAKGVDIPGTDKRDHFEIAHREDGSLEVTVRKIKKDQTLDSPFYHCIFNPKITKEIRLYGRDGEDVFTVTGTKRSSIRLRMIGGGENDRFSVDENLHNRRKTIIYDRSDKDNSYPDHSLYLNRTSATKSVNEYNGRAFVYNKLAPLATVGFNADDGLLLGIGAHLTTHGFRKEPYSSDQQLLVGHALATEATFLRYRGDFKRIIGHNDLNIAIDTRAPDNKSNFFGIGNNSIYQEHIDGIKFYRTRYNVVNAKVGLARMVGPHAKVFAGVMGQYFTMKEKENIRRFIETYKNNLPGQDIFSSKWFAGGAVGFELDTRNDKVNPLRGMYWSTELTGAKQVSKGEQSYGQLVTNATFYTSLNAYPSLVFVNRIGAGVNFGHPLFYQLLYLGGSQNLRGYRTFRFAGNEMAYHNIEARIKLFDFNSYLFPGSIGIIGFNDVGRVWARGESSGTWHDGYGGGVYLVPAQLVSLSATLAHSVEGTLPYFTLGINLR